MKLWDNYENKFCLKKIFRHHRVMKNPLHLNFVYDIFHLRKFLLTCCYWIMLLFYNYCCYFYLSHSDIFMLKHLHLLDYCL